MPISLGNYSFEGPFLATGKLRDRSGIYAIISVTGPEYYLIDIGGCSQVKACIEDRGPECRWKNQPGGVLMVAVRYTANLRQSGRMRIIRELRKNYGLS